MHKSKIGDLQIEKKSLEQARTNFKQESEAQERDLKQKLAAITDSMRAARKEETDFMKKKQEFEAQYNKTVQETEFLTEETNKYCQDKEAFDAEALALKDQGENDRLESEQIGWFKTNKELLKDKLKVLRNEIESEKVDIMNDRVKLEAFKMELSTKQKAIEQMRYNYIKND